MKTIHPFLERLYGSNEEAIERQAVRYAQADGEFVRRFGDRARLYVSTPGRTELGGNHTDHNHGRVLAAAIDLDVVAVAARRDDMKITVHSEGYGKPFVVNLDMLSARESERRSTSAMIRGVAALMKASGHAVGGMDVCMTSNVLPGFGLSSSAAVEVLFGTVFNALFNGGRIDSKEIARIGKDSENLYFGKPCGLMDQMACAVGGVVAIDFQNPEAPEVEKLVFDFATHDLDLIIVDTGGDHLALTDDYAGVPAEMKAVAGYFGKETLRDVPPDRLFSEIAQLRRVAGDRAVLRALHFMDENDRVAAQVEALQKNDIQEFIRLVRASGDSSFRWLQNVYSIQNVNSQGIPLALAITEKYFSKAGFGACRVHGGGFAGAIQVMIPSTATDGFVTYIENVFGPESVRAIKIRPFGTCFYDPGVT